MRYIRAVATTYFVGQEQDYYEAFPDETDAAEINVFDYCTRNITSDFFSMY